jgi:hypothetical protein
LDAQFSKQVIADVLRFVYPQYSLQVDNEATVLRHLEILIIIGNTSLSSPHVLSVAEMFCHLCHNPNLGEKEERAGWHSYGEQSLQVLSYATHHCL